MSYTCLSESVPRLAAISDGEKLRLGYLPVLLTGLHKFLVCSLADYRTLVKHKYLIC